MADVEFWFELASPYSYLSATRIDAEAEARGVRVLWRPFLLGPLFKAQGWETSPFQIYAAKGRYMWRDVARRCALKNVAFREPNDEILATFPLNTVKAARLAVTGLETDWGKDFVRTVYAAQFAQHRDISDPAVLSAVLTSLGLDAEACSTAAQSPRNKPKLRNNTEKAMARKVFGAPTFLVGEEMFWGDDRLEDALDWAKKAQGTQDR